MNGPLDLPNLASNQFGTSIVFATDEWFAAAENMLKDDNALWQETLYTDYGKWMDGWETRRRRTEGHDWCIIKLGMQGVISAVDVDTSYFTGNFSPMVSIQAIDMEDNDCIRQLEELRAKSIEGRPDGRMGLAASPEEMSLALSLESENWPFLLNLTALRAGYPETCHNIFDFEDKSALKGALRKVTHIRLNMGPDGGIARLRLFGNVVVDPSLIPTDKLIDLAGVEQGGQAIAYSNKHYGKPSNILVPGRGNCMGDGWETARQPKRPPVYTKGEDGLLVLPGSDWAVIQLGLRGSVKFLILDTHFYKGNYPESCLVEVSDVPVNSLQLQQYSNNAEAVESVLNGLIWKVLLPRSRLGPDRIHSFSVDDGSINQTGNVTLVRLTIYPDGGIMRMRVLGNRAGTHSKL